MSSAENKKKETHRFGFNVRALRESDGLRFEASVASRQSIVFQQTYAHEIGAALAADIANTLLHGESIVGRLNFPADHRGQEFAIDFKQALQTLQDYFSERGYSNTEAKTESRNIVFSLRVGLFAVLCLAQAIEVIDEVIRKIGQWANSVGVLEEERRSCLARVDKLTNAISTVADHQHKSIACCETMATDDATPPKESLPKESLTAAMSLEDNTKSNADDKSTTDKTSALSLTNTDEVTHSTREFASDVESNDTNDDDGTQTSPIEKLSKLSDTPNLFTLIVGCTVDNVSNIFLTQQSVFKLMNLDTILRHHGLDTAIAGVDLLNGAIVLIARVDEMKLRRIQSWDRQSTLMTLEDGTKCSPLQIASKSFRDNAQACCYLLEELNFKMDNSAIRPLVLYEMVCIQHRLSCCKQTLRRLEEESEEARILMELTQNLVNGPTASTIYAFKPLVDPMSFTERNRQAASHATLVARKGSAIKQLFRSWLSTATNADSDEDLTLDGAMRRATNNSPRNEEQHLLQLCNRGAARAKDPRCSLPERRHLKMGSDSGYVAPRRTIPIEDDTESFKQTPSSDETVGRRRKRSLSDLHRTSSIPSTNGQTSVDFSSIEDVQRSLRRLKRELACHDL